MHAYVRFLSPRVCFLSLSSAADGTQFHSVALQCIKSHSVREAPCPLPCSALLPSSEKAKHSQSHLFCLRASLDALQHGLFGCHRSLAGVLSLQSAYAFSLRGVHLPLLCTDGRWLLPERSMERERVCWVCCSSHFVGRGGLRARRLGRLVLEASFGKIPTRETLRLAALLLGLPRGVPNGQAQTTQVSCGKRQESVRVHRPRRRSHPLRESPGEAGDARSRLQSLPSVHPGSGDVERRKVAGACIYRNFGKHATPAPGGIEGGAVREPCSVKNTPSSLVAIRKRRRTCG